MGVVSSNINYEPLNKWKEPYKTEMKKFFQELYEKHSNTFSQKVRKMTDEEMAKWIFEHDEITEKKGRLSYDEILAFLKRKESLWKD